MKVTICIGSACHIKGSRQVVEQLQYLLSKNGLKEKVELCGAFCMGRCSDKVSVAIDEEPYSIGPADVESFFTDKILPLCN